MIERDRAPEQHPAVVFRRATAEGRPGLFLPTLRADLVAVQHAHTAAASLRAVATLAETLDAYHHALGGTTAGLADERARLLGTYGGYLQGWVRVAVPDPADTTCTVCGARLVWYPDAGWLHTLRSGRWYLCGHTPAPAV